MGRKKDGGMTPAQEKRENERLRTAIYRWYRLGGSSERVLLITEVIYATKLIPTIAPWDSTNKLDD